MPEPLEISPDDAHKRISGSSKALLIDVREPEEFAMSKIEGAELVPMNSVPAHLQRLEALADNAELLVFCHHGVRSLHVVNWLRSQGIENCCSISGGIDRWSTEVDPSVPRY